MKNNHYFAFLDASSIIKEGRNLNNPIFLRLHDLIECGLVSILTTDLTIVEVAKKHAEEDYSTVKKIIKPSFRSIAKKIIGVNIQEISSEELKIMIFDHHKSEAEKLFDFLKSKMISIDTVKPSFVFDLYTHNQGVFSGGAKKHQFPDAFILEAIKNHVGNDQEIVIVADDNDYYTATKDADNIKVVKTVEGLFEVLGLTIDGPDVRNFLDSVHDDLLELFDDELANWGVNISDVEDAEVDSTEISDFDIIDLTSFGPFIKGDDILIIGEMYSTVNVSYSHPDWDTAMYDSEDKVYIPFDEVSGESSITIKIKFSLLLSSDEDGSPLSIKEVSFRNDHGVWADLYSYNDYD